MSVESRDTSVVVVNDDESVYCPHPQMPLWSSHPRVFLDMQNGQAKCPYCGTLYQQASAVAISPSDQSNQLQSHVRETLNKTAI